jgi:hypothetical protein
MVPDRPGHRQLVTPLQTDGPPAFVISCSKDLERGARATLMLVERLFRFDVIVGRDSLQPVVRNLGKAQLELHPTHHNEPGTNVTMGSAPAYEPTRATFGFTLRADREAIVASVTIGALQLADRGVTRITAQAIVRQLPAPAEQQSSAT